MKKNFREYLELQIQKNNIKWESKSEIIRASGNNQNGHTARVLKEYENKFQFGAVAEIKNKEIKKYFDKQPKGSYISVKGAANQIQKELPKGIIIGETIIYNRLKDKSFNTNNLKPQTLDNQVSKTGLYDVKISKGFKDKLNKLREPGIYLYIELTQRGGQTLRLKTNNKFHNLDKSFPPNERSIKTIEKIIKRLKKNNSDA